MHIPGRPPPSLSRTRSTMGPFRLAWPLFAGLLVTAAPSPQQAQSDIPNGVFSFQSAAAAQYHVGRDIPTVPFKVPESWAGMMPIDAQNKSKGEYFFWMYPAASQAGKDDVTIWFNGGPGCSSLEGLLQEIGPYLFPYNISGQAAAYVKPNPYSWHQLSTLIAVDQPLGVDFSNGQVSATSEEDVANAFYGFLGNLYTTFPELKGKRLWLWAESYGAYFASYIAHKILSEPTSNQANGINLQGVGIIDGIISNSLFLLDGASIPFAKKYQKEMQLSDAFLQQVDANAAKHDFTDFAKANLQYPPPAGGILRPAKVDDAYAPWTDIYNEAAARNSNWNEYNVLQSVPIDDPLGFAPASPSSSANNVVNNIQGLKALIHAPNSTTWLECAAKWPFVDQNDNSPAPDEGVLPSVIERLRVVIGHGSQDFRVVADGSRLAIQNMTWGGMRGFQSEPKPNNLIVDGQVAGNWHTERQLTFAEVFGAGHMLPQDQPKAAYKLHQFLLGQTSSLS